MQFCYASLRFHPMLPSLSSSLSISLTTYVSLTPPLFPSSSTPLPSCPPSSEYTALLLSSPLLSFANIKKTMSTICADQHKLYSSHQLFSSSSKKPFKDLEIPPRKLLHAKKTFQESPEMSPYESNLHKFLPCNDSNINLDSDNSHDDEDLDPYSSDHFRMYEFKVRRCTRSRSHDWTDCPFAHPGEKARRRDLRKYQYSGAVCPEFRRGGGCGRGETCEFAHGVFECWLHPSRYRTEACKDGKNCKRKVCFFAHSSRQLRILPEISSSSTIKYDKNSLGVASCSSLNHSHCCCLSCQSVISSPTSPLLGMSHMSPPLSPSLSPPPSPVKHRSASGLSPVSRYGDRFIKFRSGLVSNEDVLNELVSSIDAMNFSNETSDASSPISASVINSTNPWIDHASFKGEDHHQQQQFILSPSIPAYPSSGGSRNVTKGDHCSIIKGLVIENDDNNIGGGLAGPDPDIGWVNELLM